MKLSPEEFVFLHRWMSSEIRGFPPRGMNTPAEVMYLEKIYPETAEKSAVRGLIVSVWLSAPDGISWEDVLNHPTNPESWRGYRDFGRMIQ